MRSCDQGQHPRQLVGLRFVIRSLPIRLPAPFFAYRSGLWKQWLSEKLQQGFRNSGPNPAATQHDIVALLLGGQARYTIEKIMSTLSISPPQVRRINEGWFPADDIHLKAQTQKFKKEIRDNEIHDAG